VFSALFEFISAMLSLIASGWITIGN